MVSTIFSTNSKGAVVEVSVTGLYRLCKPDSSTLISFCKAAIKSESIHWVLECSLARLRLTSVVSLFIIIGTGFWKNDPNRTLEVSR